MPTSHTPWGDDSDEHGDFPPISEPPLEPQEIGCAISIFTVIVATITALVIYFFF